MDPLQYKVLEFDLPADDFDPNFTPENGIQYLQQVAYERQRCPAVVVRPLQPLGVIPTMPTPTWSNWMPNSSTSTGTAAAAVAADLPDIHRPTAEWKHIQYAEFAQLRDQIAQLRPQFARRAAASKPTVELPSIDDAVAWREFLQDNRPLLSTMLRLDQPGLETLLEYQLEWLVEADGDEVVDDDDEDGGRRPATEWDLASVAALGRWIYSLLGCLHTPLEPAMHSTLRGIAKQALRIRNRLDTGAGGAEMAAPLNLLVCIIAKNFGQADLAERV